MIKNILGDVLNRETAAHNAESVRLAELEAQRDAARAERDLLKQQLAEAKLETAEVRLDLAEIQCQRDTAFEAVLGEDWELSDSQLDEVELYAILREQINSEIQAARAERNMLAATQARMIRLVEEWEESDSLSSASRDCAEQVRAVLRGEGPQWWEREEGGE